MHVPFNFLSVDSFFCGALARCVSRKKLHDVSLEKALARCVSRKKFEKENSRKILKSSNCHRWMLSMHAQFARSSNCAKKDMVAIELRFWGGNSRLRICFGFFEFQDFFDITTRVLVIPYVRTICDDQIHTCSQYTDGWKGSWTHLWCPFFRC